MSNYSEIAALRVAALSKAYTDGTQALESVSLEIPPGSFFGLLGPNGAGKSTLIGAISGLVRIPSGAAFVFEHDVVQNSRRARALLGLVPQEIHLDRFLTTREVLTYHGGYFGLHRSDAAQRADELLAAFDLAAKASQRPNRLSGGMRRRLLIARALVHRPKLLLLDEPTAGVDLELRYELWNYLRMLQTEQGVTILLTTHYIEEAEALCKRIAFIRDGRIISEGTTADLTSRYGGDRLEDAYKAAMA